MKRGIHLMFMGLCAMSVTVLVEHAFHTWHGWEFLLLLVPCCMALAVAQDRHIENGDLKRDVFIGSAGIFCAIGFSFAQGLLHFSNLFAHACEAFSMGFVLHGLIAMWRFVIRRPSIKKTRT